MGDSGSIVDWYMPAIVSYTPGRTMITRAQRNVITIIYLRMRAPPHGISRANDKIAAIQGPRLCDLYKLRNMKKIPSQRRIFREFFSATDVR
jgi:hypothetical protein